MRRLLAVSLITVYLFAAFPDAGQARLSDQQLYSLSSEATTYFRMGNDLVKSDPAAAAEQYDKAILRYERMIDEGNVANQYIYYNIGNIYLMKKDLGRAILNFKRAERFDKSFPELQKNLNYARSQRMDRISAKAEKRILTTLFFWHYDLNRQAKAAIMAVAWFAVWALGIGMMLKGKKPGLFAGFWLAGVLLIALSASLGITHFETQTEEGVVLADQVAARQGDGANYPQSFEQPLHAGTEFVLLESRNDWHHIELQNGDEAWIEADSAGLLRLGPG